MPARAVRDMPIQAVTDSIHVVMGDATNRAGYAVSSLERMGDGPGFRKVRRELGVTAFGINAIVLPPGYASGVHYHQEQEETYFVHQGQVEFFFGDGSEHRIAAGGMVRVDAATHRGFRNVGQDNAILLVAGGKDGYVGRDGQPVGENPRGGPPGAAN
jgi:mannose-6-phosphate isomerase-like protein (cupin superfamily)